MPVPHDLTQPAVAGATVVLDHSDPNTPDGRLEMPANYPWFFTHYPMDPGAWCVATIYEGPDVPEGDVGTWWLPVLTRLPCRPGLCGHRTRPKGAPESRVYMAAHNRVVERGGTVLPRSLGYVIAKECRDPVTKREGLRHLDPWSTPRVKIQNKRQRFRFDRQRYYRWCLEMIRQGHVQAPHPDVVDIRKAQLAQRVPARIARSRDMPESQRERFVGEVELAALDARDADLPRASPRMNPAQVAPPSRDLTDPEQMNYRELQTAAKALGWKTGGVRTEDLREIVRVGDPPSFDVDRDDDPEAKEPEGTDQDQEGGAE